MTARYLTRVCACCARPAIGVGVVARYKNNPLWCCDRPECLALAKETLGMDARTFNRLDTLATVTGGQEAGAYLDEIDKTDLAQLTEGEWGEFCQRLVAGYRAALEGSLKDTAPF